MKFYLAARYTRIKEMQGIAKRLTEMGHIVTSRWIEGTHDWDGVDQQRGQQLALDDLEDLLSANQVIVFTPGGTRGGMHYEFGYAQAYGIACVIVGPRQNIFHCIETIVNFDNPEQFLAAVRPKHKAPGWHADVPPKSDSVTGTLFNTEQSGAARAISGR